jgi:4-diphosphocytidyl-2-C-methyl-D-erythritol kinase
VPAPIAAFAPAKINLTLRITGRRADGYHLLDSLVVFAATGDRLTAQPASALSLTVTGPFGSGLAAEADNLVLRAARRLAEAAGVEPHGAITLEKNLPVASGIGGGSSDAAAALRLLAQFWSVALPEGALDRLALGLGADVPVCLARRPARMAGIGETLSRVPALPALGMVLVNPGVACSTAAIFRARAEAGTEFSNADAVPAAGWSTARSLAAALAASGNDLEAPAMSVAPVIGAVLEAIRAQPDCLLARMSGSGATCFGLFPDAAAAERVAGGMTGEGWWSWGGGLYDLASSAL